MPEERELITAKEVARALNVSIETIWRYTRAKKIPYLELGNKQYRYVLTDVIKALDSPKIIREKTTHYPDDKTEPFTYEEYLKLPDEPGYRFEVLEGELVKEPSPNVIHQLVSGRLQRILYDFFKEIDPEGNIFYAPLDVALDEINVVQPDLFYLSGEQKGIISETHIKGAPHLIVEILSPNNKGRDRIRKLQIYQKAGVRHYWIIDPDEQSLECFSLKGQTYALIASGLEEATLAHPDFPDLTIKLKNLWEIE